MATEEYKILVSADTKRAVNGVKGLASSFKALGAAVAVAGVIKFGNEILDASKKMQTYQNQLRLITRDQADLARLMGRLTEASIQNRTSFAATADLFQKLTITTRALNASEEDVLQVTGNLSKALAIAGADAGTANGVIRQFGQAMASGTVRGDEFNSIVEGLGPALAIMGEEAGFTIGQLRDMSRAGKLTNEVFFNIIKNADGIGASFSQLAITTEQLETQFSDSYTAMLAALGEQTGATSFYESVLSSLIRTMDKFSERAGTVANKSNEQLLTHHNTSEALKELEKRLHEATFQTMALSRAEFKANQAAIALIKTQIAQVKERDAAEKISAEATRKRLEANKLLNKTANDLVGSNDKLLKSYQNLDTTQFLDTVGKLEAKYKDSKNAVAALSSTLNKLNEQNLQNAGVYGRVQTSLEKATIARDAYLVQLDEEKKKLKEKAEADFQAAHAAKRTNEITYLSLRAATESSEMYKARIEGLIAYKTVLQNISEAENENALTTQMATLLKADAHAQYVAGYKKLESDRLEAARKTQLEEMQLFIDSEKTKRRERELTRTFELVQSGKSADDAKSIAEFENKTTQEKAQFAIGKAADTFKALGQFNKKAFQAYKAFAIAQAIQNTYLGATKAMATYPFPFNLIAAAASVAAGLAQVNSIRNQNYSGRQFGGPVTGGSTFMVGENGPEVFTPSQNGTITPNHELGGSSQEVIVNFNIEAVDAAGIDDLILQRRGMITNIIREATEANGRRSMV